MISAPAPAPVRIGPLVADPPVILAPMAGETNAPFRRRCRGNGAGLYVSEMITARALVEGNAKTMMLAGFDPDESPRSLQLYGVDPKVLGEAVRKLVGEGRVDHIDLNFGCPAPKVTRLGGGAALPVRRRLMAALLREAVQGAGDVPVTAKFRIGVDDDHLTYLDTGRIAVDEGCAAISLHARTAEQRYSGTARWEAIGTLKETITSIPVFGNGDIWEAADAAAMIDATGCDGVVVGRGCLGRPWLFAELSALFDGRPVPPPPRLGEVGDAMAEHLRLLSEWMGPERAARDFRKHAGWYLTGYPVGSEVRRTMATLTSAEHLAEVMGGLDPELELVEGGRRIRRGHTHGPKAVALPDRWYDLADAEDAVDPGAELATSGG
jgi:nifR3 family TIM-barrel protein